jgi:hypothetical protein
MNAVVKIPSFWDSLAKVAMDLQGTLDPNAVRTPGDKQCHFCSGKKQANCPEYLAQVQDSANTMFKPLEDEGASRWENGEPTNEELSAELFRFAQLRSYMGDMEALALKRGLAGNAPSGWKIVNGKRKKAFLKLEDESTKEQKERLFKKLSKIQVPDTENEGKRKAIGQDGAAPRSLISPTQMMDLEGLTAQQVTNLGKLWEWLPGGKILVPATDERDSSVEAVTFSPVTEEQQQAPEQAAPISFM